MTNAMRILIIEDNPDIAGNTGDYLELLGHVVDFASDGVMGLRLATSQTFDAIILDINMPRMNGFEVCKRLRVEHQSSTPILILSARDSLADKITGFELGAWDYVVKPFELKELSMRLEALTLRHNPSQGRTLNVGDLTLDLDQWVATRDGNALNLHRTCVRILEMLMRASPKPVSREDIEFFLWGEHPPSSSPLRSHMYELRRELDKPFEHKMLKTLRGVGFALDEQGGQHDD